MNIFSKLGTHGCPRRRGASHETSVKNFSLGDIKKIVMPNTDEDTESVENQHPHQNHQHQPLLNRNLTMGHIATNGSNAIPSNNVGASGEAITITTPSTAATTTTTVGSNDCISSSVSSAPNPDNLNGGIRKCSGCSKRITERFLLKALDLFWHEDCLKCGCCDCRLGEVGSTLYIKANLILCKRDYLRLFGTTGYCAACNKVIPAFEMVMRAKSNVYHLECFACQQCNHRFCVGDRFYLCENKILCEYDYEERLVFANMSYNPSSLAHIRRQVSNLQSVRV